MRTIDELLDQACERNARLVVRLRQLQAQLHRCQFGHTRDLPWSQCEHEQCRKTVLILAGYSEAEAAAARVISLRPAVNETP